MLLSLQKQDLAAIAVGLALFGAVACGDKPPGDDSASGGSATDTTRGGATDATTGDATATTDASATTDQPTGTTGETGDATTGGDACEIQPFACGFAAQLGGDFDDCGVVDPWNDDAAAWQAAHDCAIAAATAERAFCLVTILQGIDSDVAQAFAAQEARSYALTTFFFDSDPCGGGGCGPVLSQSSCAALTAVNDCVVAPGVACLGCDGQGQGAQVCGP